MNNQDFNKKLKEYGTLIPIHVDGFRNTVGNNTLTTKIELHPIINECMLNGCERRVVDQVIDIQRIDNYYRQQCSICKKYQHPENPEELVDRYHELIKIEKGTTENNIEKNNTTEKSTIRGPNANVRCDSLLGHKYIQYNSKMKAFIVNIWDPFQRKKTYVGYYRTLEDAINARDDAEKRLK